MSKVLERSTKGCHTSPQQARTFKKLRAEYWKEVNMSHWIRRGQVSIQDFRELLLQDIPANDYPHAEGVEKRVLIYDGAALTRLARGSSRPVILEELYRVLAEGPGVFVI